MKKKASRLLPAVQEILFREWDPIGVHDNELCRNEYDSYATSIVNLLVSGAYEFKLTSRLRDFQRVSMGMTVVDEELHRRVARRLLTLVDNT